MREKFPLTVLITTLNEAGHIEAVLDSVSWADEILVVDSFSQDDTVKLAQKKGATVLQRHYHSPADTKNWAIPQAKHEWVLILDADERCTPGLQEEIRQLLRQGTDKDCFWIRRQNFFMGKPVRFSGWQNDKVIRLLRKHCRYEEKRVHEEIDTHGQKTGILKNKLLHYTFKDSAHFLDKMRRYAEWSAIDHQTKTGKITLYHLWAKPAFRFFTHYFLRLGFLDGKRGFIISRLMAWGVFLRYLKLIEMRRQNVKNNSL